MHWLSFVISLLWNDWVEAHFYHLNLSFQNLSSTILWHWPMIVKYQLSNHFEIKSPGASWILTDHRSSSWSKSTACLYRHLHSPPLLFSDVQQLPITPRHQQLAPLHQDLAKELREGVGFVGQWMAIIVCHSQSMIYMFLLLIIIRNGLVNPLKPLLCEQRKKIKHRDCIVSHFVCTTASYI